MNRLLYIGLFLLISNNVWAQTLPVGLYEGMMGNSGVAISDSTAASFYNPSLLSERRKNSYSLGGNTYSNFISNVDDTRLSSAKLMPSYLSSMQVFDNFMHEFFVANIMSLQGRRTTNTGGISIDQSVQMDGYYAGYSMAFKDFPFGFQTGMRILDVNTYGVAEGRTATEAYTTKITSSKKRFEAIGGFGGHHTYNGYTFGYRYLTRSTKIYEKYEGKAKNFLYQSGPNTYTVTENNYDDRTTITQGENVLIGHGFKRGAHEFLLDSQFAENADLTHTYAWTQTFGYKVTSQNQHQFMCGIGHLIDKEVKYFGQSAYYSAGYSWLSTNDTSRSAIGLYYLSNKIEQDTYSYGLTFSSEFMY